MTTTRTRDTRTATQAYEENRAAIQAAIKKLQDGLSKHRKEQSKEPRDWSYAGDAAFVLELVGRAASFINGEEE